MVSTWKNGLQVRSAQSTGFGGSRPNPQSLWRPSYNRRNSTSPRPVIRKIPPIGIKAANHALAAVRENWEPETTARNLALIRDARSVRGDAVEWASRIEEAFGKRARG